MMHVIKGGGGSTASFLVKYKNANAYAGIGNAGATIKQREKSYAAAVSVPADLPKPKKPVKRVSKAERRAIVETFVNNYRELNNGIFPSISIIKKELGGGHYATKIILQEIQYKSQMSVTNEKKDSLSTKKSESVTKVHDPVTKLAKEEKKDSLSTEKSESVTKGDNPVTKKTEEKKTDSLSTKKSVTKIDDLVTKIAEEEKKDSLSTKKSESVTKGDDLLTSKVEEAHGRRSDYVETANNLPRVTEKAFLSSIEKPEDKTQTTDSGNFNRPLSEDTNRAKIVENVSEKREKKEQMVSKSSPDLNVPENKYMEHSTKENNDVEPPKQPSLWGNLKSFAINIWRKF